MAPAPPLQRVRGLTGAVVVVVDATRRPRRGAFTSPHRRPRPLPATEPGRPSVRHCLPCSRFLPVGPTSGAALLKILARPWPQAQKLLKGLCKEFYVYLKNGTRSELLFYLAWPPCSRRATPAPPFPPYRNSYAEFPNQDLLVILNQKPEA